MNFEKILEMDNLTLELVRDYDKLRSRINKAIDFILENSYLDDLKTFDDLRDEKVKELLKILGGKE